MGELCDTGEGKEIHANGEYSGRAHRPWRQNTAFCHSFRICRSPLRRHSPALRPPPQCHLPRI